MSYIKHSPANTRARFAKAKRPTATQLADLERAGRLRAALDKPPGQNLDAWKLIGRQARGAVSRLLNRPVLDDRARQSARVGIAYLLRELGYAAASKLDDVLIEYVVFSWLNLIVRDREHRAYSHCSLSPESLALLDRRLSRAQSLLDDACKSLRGVRNVSGPTPAMLYAPGLLEYDSNGMIDRLQELMADDSRQNTASEACSAQSAFLLDTKTQGAMLARETQDQRTSEPQTLEGTQ